MSASRNRHALDYRIRPDDGPGRVLYLGSIDVPYRSHDGAERLGKSCGWYTDFDAFRRDARGLWRQGAGSIFTAAQPLRPGVFEAKVEAWGAGAEDDPVGHPAWARPRLNELVIGRRGNDLTNEDVDRFGVLFVDIDPVRPRGEPATPDQVEEARRVSLDVRDHVEDIVGAPPPIVARSGNGYHLLYRCDLEADEVGTEVMRFAVAGLAKRFGSDEVSIDQSVANPGRKIRLHGLPNRKRATDGSLIAERETDVLEVPETFEVMPAGILDALALDGMPEDQILAPTARESILAWRARQQAARRTARPGDRSVLDHRLHVLLVVLARAGYAVRERHGGHEIDGCPFMGATHPSGPWKTWIGIDPSKRSPVVACVAETCKANLNEHIARRGCGYTLVRERFSRLFAAVEAELKQGRGTAPCRSPASASK